MELRRETHPIAAVIFVLIAALGIWVMISVVFGDGPPFVTSTDTVPSLADDPSHPVIIGTNQANQLAPAPVPAPPPAEPHTR